VGWRLLRVAGAVEFQSMDTHRHWVPAGSTVWMHGPSGGGWGDPLAREPERVREDVLEGFVSLDAARDDYGVVLDPGTLLVDGAATEALRSERMQAPISGPGQNGT
jgi:N-methylhydantoinase B